MRSVLEQDAAMTAYDTRDEMTAALAQSVADALDEAIARRGKASFAVSGGSTPKALYQALASAPIDWAKVTVVLVDERWVEEGEAGSNATFVRETLLTGHAAAAEFLPLKAPGIRPVDGLAEVKARLQAVALPFDVAVLGMGNDGHTASWFPHAEGLDQAMAEEGPRIAAIRAERSEVTGALVDRITLTRSALTGAGRLILMMAGEDKRATWDMARGDGPVEDMPIRALLRDPASGLETHWAP